MKAQEYKTMLTAYGYARWCVCVCVDKSTGKGLGKQKHLID